MLTVSEAMRRLAINNMGMRRHGNLNWCVYFREDRTQSDENTFITDDLDDAVIQASKMRKARETEYNIHAQLLQHQMRHYA